MRLSSFLSVYRARPPLPASPPAHRYLPAASASPPPPPPRASPAAPPRAWAGWYRALLAIKRRCGEHLDPQPRNPFLGVPKSFPGVKPEFWEGCVGDSVFVHGGLLEANVEYGLERINAEVSEWIRGEGGDNARAPEYVRGWDIVVWLRRFSDGFDCDCKRLEGVLGMIPGAKRMVMGHTIQTVGINTVGRGPPPSTSPVSVGRGPPGRDDAMAQTLATVGRTLPQRGGAMVGQGALPTDAEARWTCPGYPTQYSTSVKGFGLATKTSNTKLILNGGQRVTFARPDGYFAFHNVPAGTHLIEVSSIGYFFSPILRR
uniref:ER membrane protein complex subunit 7 beta-sandwich domain-containing protein n=1 Tax=Zea mays TaxID=4577 RepID=A0A804REX2_MAIZE